MAEKLGRYEILEEIGRGGFAIVYRGYDAALDRPVAIKELKSLLLTDADWVERFRREAKAIARLDHPRIVTIHDVGQEGQRHFLVMRLVDGSGLDEFLAAHGGLAWPEALEVLTAVAEGLDFAHSQGILHRDLKPANILMDPERGALLTDFGFAKLVGERSMSMSGDVVGTPHYIAPEAWEGRKATHRVDIYALGCILYEILTGEKLFLGETPPAVMMSHFKPLELPQTWPEGVPPGVAQILKKALARNPAERYQTAGEMIEALAVLGSEEGLADVAKEVPRPVEKSAPSPVPEDIQADAGQAVMAEPPGIPFGAQPEPVLADESADEAAPSAAEIAPEAVSPGSPATPPPLAVSPPSAATPTPQPPGGASWPHAAGPGSRRRGGCIWVSAAIIIGLGLLVVGLGTFCSALSGTVDSTVRTVVSNVFPEVEIVEPQTEPITISLPDNDEPASLKIKTDAGRLAVAPGATTGLVEGSATYNVASLKPVVFTDTSTVRLEHESGVGPILGALRNDIENSWDLKLASIPMALDINAGPARSNIELGGLSLVDLTVIQGAADFELAFSESNQVEMDTFQFTGGASEAVLTGLANAKVKEIFFKGGAGAYTLDFTGELRNDIEVVIEGGLGSVTLVVPEAAAARLSVNEETVEVRRRGDWEKSGNGYRLPGISGADHTIDFDVRMNSGRLELRNP